VHLRFVGALNLATADRGCVEDQPQRLAVDEEFDLPKICTRFDSCSAHSRGPTNRSFTEMRILEDSTWKKAIGTAKYANHAKPALIGADDGFTQWVIASTQLFSVSRGA
jgi:hypothetical protein